MEKFITVLIVAMGIVGFIVGISLLFTWPTVWIVNYLFTKAVIASLFGVSKLTFWKAFWLDVFCAGMFKGTTTIKSKE